MKASKFSGLLVLFSLISIVGCSGEEQTVEQSTANVELLQINERKMFGAWQSADKTYGYEFHASPTKQATLIADFELQQAHFQPEGIIYKEGKVSSYFNWVLLANGLLRLDVKTSACQSRPLTLCATVSSQTIEVLGTNERNLKFKIAEDADRDGTPENNFQWQLSKKQLPNLEIGDKSYLIEQQTRADSQYMAKDNNGSLELYLPTVKEDRKFVEVSRDEYSIELTPVKEFHNSVSFYVYNQGDTDIDVSQVYEYLIIYPTFDDNIIVSYKINRELVLTNGLNANDIDLDGYMINLKRSKHFGVVNVTNYIPTLEYGKPYYSNFWEMFNIDGVDSGVANQIIFIDDNKAKITARSVIKDEPSAERIFNWRKGSRDGEIIVENEHIAFILEFLSGSDVDQRYRVITSTYLKADDEYLMRYISDYFFAKNADIDVTAFFPLEFEFIHLNGVSKSPVVLHDDGTVELVNVDEVEGGRWFFNGTNELIRFECINNAEVEIVDYQECLDSFEFVATEETKTTYSHISKLTFLNKIGDNYLVQYDTSFWGGRWGKEEQIRSISVYYQWLHLTD
jgi:hypothetical protein